MQMGNISFGPSFDKLFVGFDDQFARISKMHDDLTKNIPNYPPYNIKKTDENTYVIELAVAGFAKHEIEIELIDGKMTIKGNSADDTDALEWLHKGIAGRNFTRSFILNDQVEIKDAELLNGMLKVFMERIIPEHKKPQKVEIKEPKAKSKKDTKEFLVEDPQDL